MENGVENDPRLWIDRENDKPENPTAYKDYPNPDASVVELYPKPGAPGQGRLSAEKIK